MKPSYFLLKCSSIEEALLGEKILLNTGIKCSIIPSPVKLGTGCGFSIKFGAQDLDIIKNMLATEQLSSSRIYNAYVLNDSTIVYAENGG